MLQGDVRLPSKTFVQLCRLLACKHDAEAATTAPVMNLLADLAGPQQAQRLQEDRGISSQVW